MINNKFIHIHLPRHAGQHIRGLIHEKKACYDFLVEKSHLTLKESLKELSKHQSGTVPSFCFIRNPWDWYVSRYFFRKKETISTGPATDVEKFSNDIEGFRKHLYILDKHIEQGVPLKPLKGKGLARIWRRETLNKFYQEMTYPGVTYICRFENLSKELPDILENLYPQVFKKQEISMRIKRKVNESSHLHYVKYYNDELREMIYQWDKDFIEKFGYEFGK
jgi:hypothetical protein